MIQRTFRGKVARAEAAEKRQVVAAVGKIQRTFRGKTARVNVKEKRRELASEIFGHILAYDTDSNGFIDRDEMKRYLVAVKEWGTDELYTDENWDENWPIVCELLEVADPTVGMPLESFVKYTETYRRDKLQSDLQTLRPSKAEAAKTKLQKRLAEKKLKRAAKVIAATQAMQSAKLEQAQDSFSQSLQALEEQREALEEQREAAEKDRERRVAAAKEKRLKEPAEPTPTPQPPSQPKRMDQSGQALGGRGGGAGSGNVVQPATPVTPAQGGAQGATDDVLASMIPPSAATLGAISRVAGVAAGPRMRSFELTVGSKGSPTGSGLEGAELFEGFRRVYVRARTVDSLLDAVLGKLKLQVPERESVGLVVSDRNGGEAPVDTGLRALPGRATVRLVRN